MKMIRLAIVLVASIAAGCSSQPHREAPPEGQPTAVEATPDEIGESFVALPPDDSTEIPEETAGQPDADPAAQPEATAPISAQNSRQQYLALSALPEAESRALQFYLGSQTFDYVEDGEVLVRGPIASGKASSPTPTGKFRVLSKNEDKESSRYDNEIGTPAWMPYSMQFYGNYFLHEGYLPGEPASHGCIRLGHDHARLLFERMKIGDPVVVSK
jgi:lipoprotein-anchoring transpeptidase ErfK/SrfK